MMRTQKEKIKAYEGYFNSLSNQELSEAIRQTQEKLKIMLTIAKGKKLEL